jgi:hypothetical protein
LVVNSFGCEKHFECCGAFVVEALEVWSEAGGNEASMENFECGENAGAGAIVHRFHEDAVAVVII